MTLEVLLGLIGLLQLAQLAQLARLQGRVDEFLERIIHVEAWATTLGYEPPRR